MVCPEASTRRIVGRRRRVGKVRSGARRIGRRRSVVLRGGWILSIVVVGVTRRRRRRRRRRSGDYNEFGGRCYVG